ncbi:hypothetical protein Tco_0007687 [Tanacetum coccineum]
MMLKMVLETTLQFGVAKRLSRTFRAESTGLRAEALKMLWANLVSITYLIYRIPYVPIGLRIPEEEWRGKDTSLAHLKVSGCDSFVKVKDVCGEAMKCTFICSGSDEMRYSFWDTNIHQSPGKSSNTSEGSENSRSFEDSERSDKKDSEDGASSEEEGLETSQWKKDINEEMVSLEKNRTCSLVRLPAGKKASQSLWMFKVKEEQNSNKRVLIFVEDYWNEEPCIDVHQIGDEREVEVLCSFNWPPSELIMKDGVLPERERVLYVRWYRKVRAVALLKGRCCLKFTEIT